MEPTVTYGRRQMDHFAVYNSIVRLTKRRVVDKDPSVPFLSLTGRIAAFVREGVLGEEISPEVRNLGMAATDIREAVSVVVILRVLGQFGEADRRTYERRFPGVSDLAAVSEVLAA